MKITLEPADLLETEIIIRGNVGSDEVSNLLQFLGKKGSGKILLYKEEEQFIIEQNEIIYLETSGDKVNVYSWVCSFSYQAYNHQLSVLFTSSN